MVYQPWTREQDLAVLYAKLEHGLQRFGFIQTSQGWRLLWGARKLLW